MTDTKHWVVTLAGGDDAAEVASSLTAAGFAIDQRLDAIGVITGRGDDAVAARLRTLPGVADVAAETQSGVGPPGGVDTW